MSFINPFKTVEEMSIRTHEILEKTTTPSKQGLDIELETSLLYHLDGTKASDVFQKLGSGFKKSIIIPNFRSAIRSVTSLYKAEDLYTGNREKISSEIQEELQGELTKRGIIVESVLLRDITLPQGLRSSIQAKLREEQDAKKMVFTLAKEKKEAERKQIEARGIKNFQQTVNQSITPNLLKWKGIEATEKLASSKNSKVIVVGGSDGLPLILNSNN